jgi:hypothetical protein
MRSSIWRRRSAARHLHVLRLHAGGHGLDTVIQFALGDDVVIDHHHDGVDRHIARFAGRQETGAIALDGWRPPAWQPVLRRQPVRRLGLLRGSGRLLTRTGCNR